LRWELLGTIRTRTNLTSLEVAQRRKELRQRKALRNAIPEELT
jgi:hypothetical protein